MLRYVQRPGERTWFEPSGEASPLLHRLLIQRGVDSPEAARAFLHPDEAQLHDPMLLSGMAEAVELIRGAVSRGEHICVYGDYDADGVCASAILYSYLASVGADAEVYLPDRLTEGYGLNEAAVRAIAGRAKLLVTVDCGISAARLVALAGELGLTCVVTDHHRPGDELPGCPVIDPLLGDYPFRWLCGAGVAFKLVEALGGREAAMEQIDLAAIATVADIVSLTGENRAIVALGLERINRAPRPGVAALMEHAQVELGALTSEGIGFRIGPRLNASGRMGSARRAFDLLLAEDADRIAALADELELENERRKSVDLQISREAEEQLAGLDYSAHRILLARGAGWHRGVIGLAASRLVERHHYPVIVFSEEDGVLRGSCRSIEGVDIYRTLCAAEDLLLGFGGHAGAAGLTLRAENFDALWRRLDACLFESVPAEAYVPALAYDLELGLGDLTERFVRELGALEPTGAGNPAPVFRARARLLDARVIGREGTHLQLYFAGDGARMRGVWFGEGQRRLRLNAEEDILFTPGLNYWNGSTSVEIRLSMLREGDPFARIRAAREREELLQRRFLTELLYNRGWSCSKAAPGMELGELRRRLAENPQGAYVLCAGLDAAEALLRSLDGCPIDLHLGEAPGDDRAFNSLIVWPERLGEFPRALRLLVLAGMPAPDEAPPGVELRSLPVESGLRGALPDVDRLRAVYVAARELSRRPVRIASEDALDRMLSGETGLPPACCRASLLALRDMGLVALRREPFALEVPRAARTDPHSSALWRAVERLREFVEGGTMDDRR